MDEQQLPELEPGQIAFGAAWCRCDQSLETVFVNSVDSLFGTGEEPIATFARAADAARFAKLWNADLPKSGWLIVCDTCHAEINEPSDHDGRYACREVAERNARPRRTGGIVSPRRPFLVGEGGAEILRRPMTQGRSQE